LGLTASLMIFNDEFYNKANKTGQYSINTGQKRSNFLFLFAAPLSV